MQAERTLQLASLDDTAGAATAPSTATATECGLFVVDVVLNVFDCRARRTALAAHRLVRHRLLLQPLPHTSLTSTRIVCAFPPPAHPPVAMAHLTVPFRVRLFFVRHGESQMNTAAHLLGQADDMAGQPGMGGIRRPTPIVVQSLTFRCTGHLLRSSSAVCGQAASTTTFL